MDNTMNPAPNSGQTPAAGHRSQMTLIAVLVVVVISGSALAWHLGRKNTVTSVTAVGSNGTDYATLMGQLDAIKTPNKVFNISVDGTKQVSGPTVITVKKNDAVRVNIKAVGDEEVSVHIDELGLHTESAPEDDTPGGFS